MQVSATRLALKSTHSPLRLRTLRLFCTANMSTSAVETKRKEFPKQCRPSGPAFTCPACGQSCFKPVVLQRHLRKCCPDLLEYATVATLQDECPDGIITQLKLLSQRESELRSCSLDIAFRQKDETGNSVRQGPSEIASQLGITTKRAEKLLQKALREIPLAADYDPVEVVYEDDDLVAVNKPPGQITAPKHRYTGGSIVNRIIGNMGFEPAVLHRLDMDTSGILLFAKARDIVPAIHAAFRDKTIQKRYLALAIGSPEWEELTVNEPIARVDDDVVARRVHDEGKPAMTKFRVIGKSPDADISEGVPGEWASEAVSGSSSLQQGVSLIECFPLTGRTHQIRVHLAHAGHPIIGDELYGITGPWMGRQALHAFQLTFEHPRNGKSLTLCAPVAEDFRIACSALGVEQSLWM